GEGEVVGRGEGGRAREDHRGECQDDGDEEATAGREARAHGEQVIRELPAETDAELQDSKTRIPDGGAMETQAHPGPPLRRGRAVTLTVRGAAMLAAAAIALVVAYIAGWPELLLLACFAGIPPLLALLHVSRMRPRLTVARFTSP